MKLTTRFKSLLSPLSSKIAYRIVLLLFCSLLAIAALVFILIGLSARNIEQTGERALRIEGVLLTGDYAAQPAVGLALQSGTKEVLEQAAEKIFASPDVLYVVFYDLSDEKVYSRGSLGFDPEDFYLSSPSGKELQVAFQTADNGARALDVLRPIVPSGPGPGGGENQVGWLRVGLSPERYRSLAGDIYALGYVMVGLLAALVIFIGVLLRREVSRPIMALAGAARNIGADQAAGKIGVHFKNELGVLSQAFNELAGNTRQRIAHTKLLVDSLTETIGLITKTTDDIYAISAQQSSGATQQAASVYQASSTSKEIAASATRIADTAEEMAGYARQTSAASDVGKVELNNAIYQVNDVTEKVELVAGRMVELGAKSQKISGIIDIINEISEQTNLLSLNAAIEAAGAGEGGKRFSVVAQEIRRLAGRTLEATQVVRQLVEEIQTATNATVMVTWQSMKSSKEAGQSIDRMNQSFQNILELVEQALKASTEITLSTRQQTSACEQMVSTIMEVSEVASEVEKGAKETELALSRLRELSADLKTLAQAGLSGEA